ncbi:solute carrier family 23 protein, partial [Acinetobacter baumannii]|nr:NCS2 family permease [Acinetobacter baumannii]EKX2530376.1 NCS2 family permease [Acinetobacter baumannii]
MAAPNSSAGWLERLFKLSDNKTTFRTEVLAGVTTFLTMCYIIIVNPLILSETGMDHGAVFVATCLAAAIGCLVMGIIANYPIALAPGMGLNAYFTYSVCMGMGVPWQTALAAVFVSGVVFLAISFFKIREAIVNAIPMSLKFAIGGGIGLFLALIALKNAGIIVANQATLVGLGDIKQPTVL